MSSSVSVLFFGQLADITRVDSIRIDDAVDTDTVLEHLLTEYPALKDHKYIVALDKEVISGNSVLSGNQTLALLPPYAGG